MNIKLVAAVADNRVIGADGSIPWYLPGDFAHFKRETAGHALVVGRATYESFPRRPLPGRPNIVITRSPDWSDDGAEVAHSFDEALELAKAHGPDIAILGGAVVYAEALPLADEQVITKVHLRPEGDVHYPLFDRSEWRETAREARREGDVTYDWVWLSRAS